MIKRKINKKIGIANNDLKYFEITDDNINSNINNINLYNKFDAIKINIKYYNNKILIKLYKYLIKVINMLKIDTTKYLFFIENDNNIYYLNELVAIYEADKIDDLNKKYSYIYDYVSKELEERFNNYNICNFEDNICCRKKCLLNKFNIEILKYGCCYTKGKVCKYLDKNHCTINCLPCKFFTCNYLKRRGYKYKPNDFSIINYFFNNKQKKILTDCLFTDKKDILDLLIKKKDKFIK